MDFPGFTSFGKDPFFDGHNDRLKEFNRSFMNDFTLMRPYPREQQAVDEKEEPMESQASARDDPIPDSDVFGVGDMFNSVHHRMNTMMRNMMTVPDELMQRAAPADDAHTYMQSSVYSYNNIDDDSPTVYEAHKSRRTGPGGIAEEKKAIKDSKKNLEKMRISRRIKGREHVVEKTRKTDTDELQTHENVVGIEEGDVETFKTEWQEAASGMHNWLDDRSSRDAIKSHDDGQAGEAEL